MENKSLRSPFVGILEGKEPGNIIARDDQKRLAVIESLEPEAAIHWLAVPYETGYTTEELASNDPERFLQLVNFAIAETKARSNDYPELGAGFTLKFHCGAYETIQHAKLHILSIE